MFKVGDSVFIVEYLHNGRYEYPSRVTKVGHKYIYASSNSGNDLQFHLSPTPDGYLRGVSKDLPKRLYACLKDYEAHTRLTTLRQSVFAYFSGYSANSDLTLEQCEAIAQIVGLELP